MHIHSICHKYTRYVWYIVLKVNYAFLYISGFNIILSSTMSLVCCIELCITTWKWNFNIHCIYVVYARHIQQQYIYMEYTWFNNQEKTGYKVRTFMMKFYHDFCTWYVPSTYCIWKYVLGTYLGQIVCTSTYLGKKVRTWTEQNKVVQYHSMWCTDLYWYVPSTYYKSRFQMQKLRLYPWPQRCHFKIVWRGKSCSLDPEKRLFT
jgi:hypothetical protein